MTAGQENVVLLQHNHCERTVLWLCPMFHPLKTGYFSF